MEDVEDPEVGRAEEQPNGVKLLAKLSFIERVSQLSKNSVKKCPLQPQFIYINNFKLVTSVIRFKLNSIYFINVFIFLSLI